MVQCGKCGVEMNYLPFRCKYCGGTFCRDHRLPENHDCTGHFTAPIVIPAKLQKEMGIEIEPEDNRERKRPLYRDNAEYTWDAQSKKLNKHRVRPTIHRSNLAIAFWRYPVTYTIMTLSIVGYILSLIPQTYMHVSVIPDYVFHAYYFHTLITAVINPNVGDSYFAFLFLFIVEFMLFSFGRQMEMRYGRKFLLTIILVSGFFTGAFFLVSVGLWSFIPGYKSILSSPEGIGTNFAIIIAIFVFLTIQTPNQQVMFFFLLPMKMRTATIIFLLIATVPLFFSWLLYGDPTYICFIIAYLGAVLGGYVMAKFTVHPPVNRPPIQFIET
ncbi:MAG TPA: AN1-type zinc finger domain-containing protein [Candidatus Lokiarchaeia archaeon]|nr:AN1-type zinc finger domain-containing protein [Candidatus Lokiarchaeia archaeon]